jgi:KUP system potassium uptake protein
MLVWFATIAALGIRGSRCIPRSSRRSRRATPSTSCPRRADGLLRAHLVVLAFTGVEALYADMGHFGRPAITRGLAAARLPACILSYLGQGALILDDPECDQRPVLPG